MEIIDTYKSKMMACDFKEAYRLVALPEKEKVDAYLKKEQKNSQGNRLERWHIEGSIQKIEPMNAHSGTTKLVVAVANPINSEPYYWSHLAFLIQKNNGSWELYGYLRGQFKKNDLPPMTKNIPHGYKVYQINTLETSSKTLNITAIERLKNKLHLISPK